MAAVWCLRMKALCPVIVVRSSVQNPATIPCDQRLFQVSAPPLLCRRRVAGTLPLPTHQNGWATPNRLVRCLMAGMACRQSGRNGCFGAAVQAFYTVPEQYQQSLGDRCAHCRVLRTLPAFGHSIARRSLDEVPSS